MKGLKKLDKLELILLFTGVYLLIFTIFALIKKNYEFAYYSVIVIVVFTLLVKFHRRIYLSVLSMFALSIAQLLHIAGISIFIGSVRLYDIWIIKGYFRYDNLVHMATICIVALAMYDILKNYLHDKIHYNKILLCVIIILISCGIGSLSEVMEYGAVIFFHAAERVGTYDNNARDLLFNFFGSVIGVIIIISQKNYRQAFKKSKD